MRAFVWCAVHDAKDTATPAPAPAAAAARAASPSRHGQATTLTLSGIEAAYAETVAAVRAAAAQGLEVRILVFHSAFYFEQGDTQRIRPTPQVYTQLTGTAAGANLSAAVAELTVRGEEAVSRCFSVVLGRHLNRFCAVSCLQLNRLAAEFRAAVAEGRGAAAAAAAAGERLRQAARVAEARIKRTLDLAADDFIARMIEEPSAAAAAQATPRPTTAAAGAAPNATPTPTPTTTPATPAGPLPVGPSTLTFAEARDAWILLRHGPSGIGRDPAAVAAALSVAQQFPGTSTSSLCIVSSLTGHILQVYSTLACLSGHPSSLETPRFQMVSFATT
jgi:hypothetical protein